MSERAAGDHRAIHLLIEGVVQGVCYRAYTQRKARELGLVGWVKNLPDGSVEAVAEGPADALRELELWCHQGSPAARVRQVKVTSATSTGASTGFEVRY